MRVVFFGTPPFAAGLLEDLLEQPVQVVGVVTRPDRPQGRRGAVFPSAVKEVALRHKLPLFQPEKASTESFLAQLSALQADLFLVVAYGEILRQPVLDLPAKGCVNIHAALLPHYRGAAPIQRALMAGEKETGVTLMHMVRQMDAGDMILWEKIAIGPETTYGELQNQLQELAKPLIHKLLLLCAEGALPRTVQDTALVTLAPKIELEECKINFHISAHILHDLIRGVNPEPGAWCWVEINGKIQRLKIYRSRIVDRLLPIGVFLFEQGQLMVGCGLSSLILEEVQLEGKKRMEGAVWARGWQQIPKWVLN